MDSFERQIVEAYVHWLDMLEYLVQIQWNQSVELHEQWTELDRRLWKLRIALEVDHSTDMSNKAELSRWFDVKYLFGRNAKALRPIVERLQQAMKVHTHVEVARSHIGSTGAQLKELASQIKNIKKALVGPLKLCYVPLEIPSLMQYVVKSFLDLNDTQTSMKKARDSYIESMGQPTFTKIDADIVYT